MKRLLILFLALFLAACTCEPPVDPGPSLETNKAIVRNYLQSLINDADTAAWDEFFGETLTFNGMAMSQSDMEGMVQTFRSILTGYRIEVVEQIAEGDVVATRIVVHGKHDGDYMGLKASGKEVSFGGLAYDRIVDGRVVESWHEMNLWGTLLMASDD